MLVMKQSNETELLSHPEKGQGKGKAIKMKQLHKIESNLAIDFLIVLL